VSWASPWENILYDRLLVILETTIKCVPVIASIWGHLKWNVAEEIGTIKSCRHWASDVSPVV